MCCRSGPGSEGAPVKVENVREWNWQLLNGTLIRRFAYSFSLTCALPPGSGESLDLLFVASWCGGVHRERSLLGYLPPRISSILPANIPVGGPGGGGVLLTFLGSHFGVSPPRAVCSSQSATGEICEGTKHHVDSLAGYLRGSPASGSSHTPNLLPCASLAWTSGSSIRLLVCFHVSRTNVLYFQQGLSEQVRGNGLLGARFIRVVRIKRYPRYVVCYCSHRRRRPGGKWGSSRYCRQRVVFGRSISFSCCGPAFVPDGVLGMCARQTCRLRALCAFAHAWL